MSPNQIAWMRAANALRPPRPHSTLKAHRAIAKARQWAYGKPGRAKAKTQNTWRPADFGVKNW